MGRLTRKHMYFNSHPHEEDDGEYVFYQDVIYISTHILTRRMTIRHYIPGAHLIFQLTSSRGG